MEIFDNKNEIIDGKTPIVQTTVIKYHDLYPRNRRVHKGLDRYPDNYKSGVYILWANNDIVYVGQTENFIKRIKTHKSKVWKWNFVSWIPVEDKLDRLFIELLLIRKFKPKYNTICNYRVNETRRKICKKCKEEYSATEKYFCKNKYNKDGLSTKCKKCMSRDIKIIKNK